jgi:hypothetical protein
MIYHAAAKTLFVLVVGADHDVIISSAVYEIFFKVHGRTTRPEAGYFILYLLSPAGQRIPADFGCIPVYAMFVHAPPALYSALAL